GRGGWGAVAPVCGAAASDVCLVLGGARNAGGVRGRYDCTAIAFDQHLELLRRQHRIERDFCSALGQVGDGCFEFAWIVQIGKLGETGGDLPREFALVHEELVLAVGGENGEAQRQRRVRHLAATDAAPPGDGGGAGAHGI